MSTAVRTPVLMDIAIGQTGAMIQSGKYVKGWEEVAQLGCC